MRHNSKPILKTRRTVSFVILFAAVGLGLLLLAQAANPIVRFEAENTQTANAIVVNDTQASNGAYLQFSGGSAPAPTGSRPGPSNTGPRIALTKTMTGSAVATAIKGGQRLFEAVQINGQVIVPTGVTGTVTFRNFVLDAQYPQGAASTQKLTGNSAIKNCYGGAGCMTIVAEDGEIKNFGENGAIADGNYTVRRLRVHDGIGDGFKAHRSNVLIEATWVYNLGNRDGAHADFLQTGGGDANNITVRGSYCNFEKSKLTNGYKANSCYINGYDNHPHIVATYENNWLMGGNITMNCGLGSDITVRNNIFSRDYATGIKTSACNNIWINNKFDDGSPAL